MNRQQAIDRLAWWIRFIGRGFHVDNHGMDYVYINGPKDGQPWMGEKMCLKHDRDMDTIFQVLGNDLSDVAWRLYVDFFHDGVDPYSEF